MCVFFWGKCILSVVDSCLRGKGKKSCSFSHSIPSSNKEVTLSNIDISIYSVRFLKKKKTWVGYVNK